MRKRGYTRPVSIIQVRADARKKYRQMGYKKMLSFITPVCKFAYCISSGI